MKRCHFQFIQLGAIYKRRPYKGRGLSSADILRTRRKGASHFLRKFALFGAKKTWIIRTL